MLIWCLKQVKHFILKFPINGSFFWGTQNYEAYYLHYIAFLTSGEAVDRVLVRLSQIKESIKDASLMSISLSVKHPQASWELWMIFQYVEKYFQCAYIPIQSTIAEKNISWKSKYETKRSMELRYVDYYFFKMDGSISVLGRLFFNWSMSIYQNIN